MNRIPSLEQLTPARFKNGHMRGTQLTEQHSPRALCFASAPSASGPGPGAPTGPLPEPVGGAAGASTAATTSCPPVPVPPLAPLQAMQPILPPSGSGTPRASRATHSHSHSQSESHTHTHTRTQAPVASSSSHSNGAGAASSSSGESASKAEPVAASGAASSSGESQDAQSEEPKMRLDDEGNMVFRELRMKCTHCPEAFSKTHDLYRHIRSHQNHTKCPYCNKTLTCMATFVYHVRTHTGEKPYFCPVPGCDFTNAVKYNLKVHLACVKHGGKANLAKYAKVLDLDVCERSLRKRKDNSVHELGSRRSKKRRKLPAAGIKEEYDGMDHLHMMYPGVGGYDASAAAAAGMGDMSYMYPGMSAMSGMGGYGAYYPTAADYGAYSAVGAAPSGPAADLASMPAMPKFIPDEESDPALVSGYQPPGASVGYAGAGVSSLPGPHTRTGSAEFVPPQAMPVPSVGGSPLRGSPLKERRLSSDAHSSSSTLPTGGPPSGFGVSGSSGHTPLPLPPRQPGPHSMPTFSQPLLQEQGHPQEPSAHQQLQQMQEMHQMQQQMQQQAGADLTMDDVTAQSLSYYSSLPYYGGYYAGLPMSATTASFYRSVSQKKSENDENYLSQIGYDPTTAAMYGGAYNMQDYMADPSAAAAAAYGYGYDPSAYGYATSEQAVNGMGAGVEATNGVQVSASGSASGRQSHGPEYVNYYPQGAGAAVGGSDVVMKNAQ